MKEQTNEIGVYPGKKKDGTIYYRASITYKRKHISLGSFASSDSAHKAYLEASTLLSDPSLSLLSYHSSGPAANILSFEKWVILLNFRDNGLYFGKPIYLGQKMFSYYLSPGKILKFDLDDLFYFSSHKIMCRGNHYFVQDYGMQINVTNRYGIKNYAVEGKDYIFLNGDRLDFRRVNLKIRNTYHGVVERNTALPRTDHSLQKKGQCNFTARIHVHGNFVIGHYQTPLEAAIAYNKAIDILKKNGCTKNFQSNYIEGLSPKSYVEIYSSLKISPKIQALTFPCNQ